MHDSGMCFLNKAAVQGFIEALVMTYASKVETARKT